jgi:hypothetical protein
MKYLEHTLKTYVYSHCNMCNIPIYFYNIKMKHLQHRDETSETYSYNMGFTGTNGGTPVRRLTAAHGPCCAAAARATRWWARLKAQVWFW